MTLSSLLFAALISFLSALQPNGLLIDLCGGDNDALISSNQPKVSWIVPSDEQGTIQTAYQLQLKNKHGRVIWDSGRVDSSESTAVTMQGAPLEANKQYSWRVRCWNNYGKRSKWSKPQHFITASIMDGAPAHRKLVKSTQNPIYEHLEDNIYFADFGKAAFARIKVNIVAQTDSFTLRLGEDCKEVIVNGTSLKRVNNSPKGNIRYCEYKIACEEGKEEYLIEFRPDPRNTDRDGSYNESDVRPIYMPDYIGEVYPFRYCELEARNIGSVSVERYAVNYPFNDDISQFSSSSEVLNQVWDLCKYSIKATSFCGIYVDGDRERIAYEADALINQLCHYGVDREYSMARKSIEHLIEQPTWPTEWCLQTLIMVWNDYMYTGDDSLLKRHYDVLKAKTLIALSDSSGLISTKNIMQRGDVLSSIKFRGSNMRDIVDWPQGGEIGEEKERAGEADGYVFTDHNTVVNAFHYEAVRILSLIAKVVGEESDSKKYSQYCNDFLERFNALLLDSNGLYRDGLETDHNSLHANMMPLAFGMVPQEKIAHITEYIKSRKMACSVYGAQFLLDALYAAGEGEYALSLLSSTAERSWYNMIRLGSTITLEAWDNRYKANLDWNHAWGAVPAGAIPRGLLGIRPIEPGCKIMEIRPQLGTLKSVEALIPTIRGEIGLWLSNGRLSLSIPANMEAILIDNEGSKTRLHPGWHEFDWD